jgi:serine/threonine-protein kinase RsbW
MGGDGCTGYPDYPDRQRELLTNGAREEVPPVNRKSDDGRVVLARQTFTMRNLHRLRLLVAWAARKAGLSRQREEDLVLAVNEAASNAIKYADGGGHLELTQDDQRALIAKITDDGPGLPSDVHVEAPPTEDTGGRGLFLIHRTCDHVEYRTGPAGTTVRLRMDLKDRP